MVVCMLWDVTVLLRRKSALVERCEGVLVVVVLVWGRDWTRFSTSFGVGI